MEEFFTKKKAGEGKKMLISLPDGSASEHWLTVLGIDSENYRIAELVSKRSLAKAILLEDDSERALCLLRNETDICASLVSGWSFDKPCTAENVTSFLTECPQIEEKVNRFASNRSAFFSQGSTSSADGSKAK